MDKDEVNVAIESAEETLNKDENFSWIKESSYLLRAYYLGLFAGLKSLTDINNLNGILLRSFASTLFGRSGDDKFMSTQIGSLYNELKEQTFRLERKTDKQDILFQGQLEQLNRLIEKLDHSWKYHYEISKQQLLKLKEIMENLGSPESLGTNEKYDLIFRMLEDLEKFLRILALIEIDHTSFRINFPR